MCSGTRSVGSRTMPSGKRPISSIASKGTCRKYDCGMPVERLESLLRVAFPDADELRVEDRTGGGDHFQVTVASPRLGGPPVLDQHRLVNDAPAEPLRDGSIHELRIKTKGTT